MRTKLKDIDKKWQVYALSGCVCILFYVVLTHLKPIFTQIGIILGVLKPVIIGISGAYIINPLAKFLYDKVFSKIIRKPSAKSAKRGNIGETQTENTEAAPGEARSAAAGETGSEATCEAGGAAAGETGSTAACEVGNTAAGEVVSVAMNETENGQESETGKTDSKAGGKQTTTKQLTKKEQKKLKRQQKKAESNPAWTVSVFLTLLIVLTFLTLLMALIVPQTVDSITTLISKLKNIKLDETPDFIAGISFINEATQFLNSDGALLETIAGYVADNMQQILSLTTAVGNTAVNWAVGAIFIVYFLMAKNSIKDVLDKLLKVFLTKISYGRTKSALEQFNTYFSQYIVYELLDALIIGVVCYIFMLIAGIPNAALISVISAVTNLIPTFGPVIGAALSCFILFVAAPETILLFLIFTAVLQSLDAYVIKPLLFGDVLDVPGLLILVAVIIFGKTMGIIGMLIAIPVAACICYICKEWYSDHVLPIEMSDYKKQRAKEEKEEKVAMDAKGARDEKDAVVLNKK